MQAPEQKVKDSVFLCHPVMLNRFSYTQSLALFCWYPPSFCVQFRLHLEPLEDSCIVCLSQTQLRAARYRFWHYLKASVIKSRKKQEETGRKLAGKYPMLLGGN